MAGDERRTIGRSGVTEWVHSCERCGERMQENHCKIVCPRCGFCRGCSDP